MKVKDYKKYAHFKYETPENNNIYKLGDVVIKPKDWEGETINEIGVVLQVHDNSELRTDMFGNECNSMLRLATLEEITEHRPEILKDLEQ